MVESTAYAYLAIYCSREFNLYNAWRKHINIKMKSTDDIGLEIPHVETNLISTTCNRWWIFEV